MTLQLKDGKSKASLAVILSAGFLLLHVGPAKANPAPMPTALNLPADFQWTPGKTTQTGGTSASAVNAINSLSYAKTNSSSYNNAWYYYTEIYFNKNLPEPTGSYTTPTQNSGGSSSNIQAIPTGPVNGSLNPLSSLNYAELNSPSYNGTWLQDTNLFLTRDLQPSGGTPTDVPEPGSLPLLATGLLGLVLIGFKRKTGRLS